MSERVRWFRFSFLSGTRSAMERNYGLYRSAMFDIFDGKTLHFLTEASVVVNNTLTFLQKSFLP